LVRKSARRRTKATGTAIADASGAGDATARLIPNGDASGVGRAELDFLTQVQVIEALSIADASAGWCAMIGIDGGYMTAYIDQSVAREMYSDIDSVTAIIFAPPGKAVKTSDGYIVNGRWPYGSGCQHATWLIGHFTIFDGDSPRLQPNGVPETRFGFLPAREGETIDTWTTNGLRGSGSHDWAVKDGFIPRRTDLQFGGAHDLSERAALRAAQSAVVQGGRGRPRNCAWRDRRLRRIGQTQAINF
jgi:alkylation response protein AidB-like acyl-CoA dehydrogenase